MKGRVTAMEVISKGEQKRSGFSKEHPKAGNSNGGRLIINTIKSINNENATNTYHLFYNLG